VTYTPKPARYCHCPIVKMATPTSSLCVCCSDRGRSQTVAKPSGGGGGASVSQAGPSGKSRAPSIPGKAFVKGQHVESQLEALQVKEERKKVRLPSLDADTYYPTMLPFQDVGELLDSGALSRPVLPADLAEVDVCSSCHFCTLHECTPKVTGLSRLIVGDESQELTEGCPEKGSRARGSRRRLAA
jgi:hypothetical protein